MLSEVVSTLAESIAFKSKFRKYVFEKKMPPLRFRRRKTYFDLYVLEQRLALLDSERAFPTISLQTA